MANVPHQYPKKLIVKSRKAAPVRDENGEVDWTNDDNFDVRFSCWGRVLNQTGREFVQLSQQFGALDTVLAVPSSSETRAIIATDRVTYDGGRTLDVLSAYDREDRQDEVVIACGEVTA